MHRQETFAPRKLLKKNQNSRFNLGFSSAIQFCNFTLLIEIPSSFFPSNQQSLGMQKS